ncbi:MAG: two component transcriptional regulator, winged helix family [Herbinix sp.]|nr:two component transcriptional regulator, winged helix family [Herbinix sp.]
MYKILIVEDDSVIATLLEDGLRKWGFESDHVTDFVHVIDQFQSYQPHLVLLDISLPFFNGYYWCNEIRKQSKVPIVFLSSRTENMDIIMAMNMGGDDFVTKPFSLDIVIAKLQAVLRRAYSYYSEITTLEVNGVILNLNDTSVTYQDKKLELTKNEYKIMQVLMEQKNQVVTRDQLMKKLWDNDTFIDDNTLTVNVNRLRKKLEDCGLSDFINTKKGLGYMIHD